MAHTQKGSGDSLYENLLTTALDSTDVPFSRILTLAWC